MTRETHKQRLDRLEAELRHAMSDGDNDLVEQLEIEIEEARIDVDVERVNKELHDNGN